MGVMRFLTVAERELRAASRRKLTYRGRWVIAAAFLALLIWLGWAFDVFANRGAGPAVFQAFSVCLLVYCLFVGAAETADCLSREKREGTLGLLFLTNLNSAEIVAGKLFSNARAPVFSPAAGFVASAVSVRQFPALAVAIGLALFFGGGLSGLAAAMRSFGCPASVADTVAAFCPLRT